MPAADLEQQRSLTNLQGSSLTELQQSNFIKLSDLSELKVLHAPPDCIIKVVKATFILLGYSRKELSWKHCKRLLGQKGGAYFLNTIMNFEPSMTSDTAITDATNELRDLDMGHVLCSSLAAAGLFMWCLRVILE